MSNAQLAASARADIQTLLDALDTYQDSNNATPYQGGVVKLEFQRVKALSDKYVANYAPTQLDELAAQHHLCEPGALNKDIFRLQDDVYSLEGGYREYGNLLRSLRFRLSKLATLTQHDTSPTGEMRHQSWLTVSDAARVAGCNAGTITRAADAGNLKSNGKTHNERRIDAADLTRWMLLRSNKPEQVESDEAVEAKLKKSQAKK